MMKTLFILLILFASIALGIQLHGDPGYVLIVMRQWSIESTVWVALGAVFLFFLLLYFLFSTCGLTLRLPKLWHRWRKQHRIERARDKTTQGLIEFSEGYWKAAKTHLIQGLTHTETPLINYLMAARAAQELGDTKLRDHYLREAQHCMPDAKIAVELTQAQLQLAHEQWEQALATLRHLHDLAPRHPYVLKLLAELYEAIQDYKSLIELLPDLSRNKALTPKLLTSLTYRAYLGSIEESITEKSWDRLNHTITTLPKTLKYNASIMTAYAEALIQQDKTTQAEITLRRTLQKNLDANLLKTYTKLPPLTVRLNAIESLLKQYPHSASLHHRLGELYAAKQLFGKAQTHLEQSLKIKASAETYLSLGELFEQLKDTPQAFEAYKLGLEKALTAQQ